MKPVQPTVQATAKADSDNFGHLIRSLRQPQESQRSMVAARLANLEHGGDRKSDNQTANLQHDVSRKEAAEKLNVSERSVKPDRVPGGKRSARFQRKYAKAIQGIVNGLIKPEVKPVAAHVSCSTRTASSILTKAVKDDERFSRDTRGRIAFAA